MHFSNLIVGIAFSSCSDALLTPYMIVKRRPFNNKEARAYWFWQSIHEQSSKCEQFCYRGTKAMRCFCTNMGVFASHKPRWTFSFAVVAVWPCGKNS